jgi:hypothetical protein
MVRNLKLESLDPYRRRGDGETGRNNSHRVYVNRSQGNDTVLETRNNDGKHVWRDKLYIENLRKGR